jgi:HPt (histidine-containing phosphotransfer) domain-containing protein
MIDWVRVRDLHDEIGSDGFAEVVDLFLAETGQVVSRLRDNPDQLALEDELHFLKGGVLNLGFTQVAALCQTGESVAAKGQALHVDVTEIIQAYELAQASFLAELPIQLPCHSSAR